VVELHVDFRHVQRQPKQIGCDLVDFRHASCPR
jgi:hypothetical protein